MEASTRTTRSPSAARFSQLPPERSSITETSARWSANAATRCEPMNPAPPVTSTRFHANAGEAQRPGILGVRKIRQCLRGLIFWIAREHPLLPGDHVQIAIVDHDEQELLVPPFAPVFFDGDQHVDPVHLHGPIAGGC